MDNTTSVWLIIAVAAVLANVPFLNNRWLALLPKRDPTSRKGLQWRLLELVVMGRDGCVLCRSDVVVVMSGWVWGGTVIRYSETVWYGCVEEGVQKSFYLMKQPPPNSSLTNPCAATDICM